jgi:hypothetical protein
MRMTKAGPRLVARGLPRPVFGRFGLQSVEVCGLLDSGGQPLDVANGEDRVQKHQALDCDPRGHRPAVAVRRFRDEEIQRLVIDVIDPRAVVSTPDLVGVPTLDQLVEERVASPAAVRDSGEACILPRDADTGVAHHLHQEARLAFRETAVDDGPNAFVLGHRQSSSARPPLRPPRRPAPLVWSRRLSPR